MLSRNEKISANGEYTFRFNSDGFFKLSAGDIQSRLQGTSLPLTVLGVTYEGGIGGFFGSVLVVSFRWMQTGWTVEQVQANIAQVATRLSVANLTFVSASGGTDVMSTSDTSGIKNTTIAWGFLALLAIVLVLGFGHGLSERI